MGFDVHILRHKKETSATVTAAKSGRGSSEAYTLILQ